MKKLALLLPLIAAIVTACTSTGGVDPNAGQRIVDDVACGLAVASAVAGNPASIAAAAAACGQTFGNAAQDAQAAQAWVEREKARRAAEKAAKDSRP